ncbi:rho gtpase activator [Diplodia corticola]|uniref:non-specific serine/threonine protein kinase n=1 Tax=Diplodia corticola TaxID=236234 RepID=A0A1J9R563_9PEZI|nr:rho gtpase activator [Diplodia corticola]OJD35689.1 rho gtpase activator [Diplodia corticola]
MSVAEKSSELLAAYFPTPAAEASTRTRRFTDTDIETIASLLEDHDKSWSRAPRAYIVLRTIGHLDLLNDLLQLGFTDHWFPVEASALPPRLQPSVRNAIVKAQQIILTKSVDLEKGENGKHWHFAKGEPQPFKIAGVLGSGGYSQVHRIRSTISFKEYALKRIRRRRAFGNASKEAVRQFTTELKLLKSLKHRHMAEYVGSFTDPSYLGLIMAPVADMNLAEYLETISTYPEHSRRSSLITLRSFFGCMASALQYLHDSSIRHRDIKPQNVLVDGSNVLFTDFGLSKDYSGDLGSTTSGATSMTPRYAAPEVLTGDRRNTSSDIWSLGCVFLEMIVVIKGKKTSFLREHFLEHGSKEAYICKNVEAAEELLKSLKGSETSSDDMLLELTGNMLKEDRSARPTASEAFMTLSTPLRNDSAVHFCGICCLEDEVSDSHDSLCEDPDTSVTMSSIPKPPGGTSVLVPKDNIPTAEEASPAPPDLKYQGRVSNSHDGSYDDPDKSVTIAAIPHPLERHPVQNSTLAVQPPTLATLNFPDESLSSILDWSAFAGNRPVQDSSSMSPTREEPKANSTSEPPESVDPDQMSDSSSNNKIETPNAGFRAPKEARNEISETYKPSFSISGLFRSKRNERSTPKLSRRFAKLLRRPKLFVEDLGSPHEQGPFPRTEATENQGIVSTKLDVRPIFGVKLQDSIRYANIAISLANEKGTDAEEIFARSGTEARVSELCTAFDCPPRFGKGFDWNGYTAFDIATVMIRYLESLPESLIPAEFYDTAMLPLKEASLDLPLEHSETIYQNMSYWIPYYRKLVLDMPPLNMQLLLYLLDLFAVFAGKSELNKMTTARLAKVFSGMIIGTKNSDGLANDIVLAFLIENQDSFLMTDFTESTSDTVMFQ